MEIIIGRWWGEIISWGLHILEFLILIIVLVAGKVAIAVTLAFIQIYQPVVVQSVILVVVVALLWTMKNLLLLLLFQ